MRSRTADCVACETGACVAYEDVHNLLETEELHNMKLNSTSAAIGGHLCTMIIVVFLTMIVTTVFLYINTFMIGLHNNAYNVM